VSITIIRGRNAGWSHGLNLTHAGRHHPSPLADARQSSSTDVTQDHIRAVKGCGQWGPGTLKTKFSELGGFLRWADNPLSDGKNPVWRLPAGFVDRRPGPTATSWWRSAAAQ
jgi:hypothetical protein